VEEEDLRGKERRRDERRRLPGTVSLSWTTAGIRNSCVGNSFDISAHGLLVEAPLLILDGTKVAIQINGGDERHDAVVRHCRKHGAWYRIGLQLNAAARRAVTAAAQ
jgi:PilZ domain-containing protein